MITMSTSNEMETTQKISNAIIRYKGQQELEEDTEIVCITIFSLFSSKPTNT